MSDVAARLRERIVETRYGELHSPFWNAVEDLLAYTAAKVEALEPLRAMGLITQKRLDDAEAELRAFEGETRDAVERAITEARHGPDDKWRGCRCSACCFDLSIQDAHEAAIRADERAAVLRGQECWWAYTMRIQGWNGIVCSQMGERPLSELRQGGCPPCAARRERTDV